MRKAEAEFTPFFLGRRLIDDKGPMTGSMKIKPNDRNGPVNNEYPG